MNWKVEMTSCVIAIALIADASAQSNSQSAETNRSYTVPTVTGTAGFSDRVSTNWIFHVLLPDGSLTNITVYSFNHNPTNTLFQWIRPDGTYTNIPVGPLPHWNPPRPLPEFINSPTTFHPVGDFWLPGEFQNLNKGTRGNEQRRSEVR
jgi:hypothetical protein